MSKYNLIDIFENYKIGSGWTTDFDYDGMLKAGLKAGGSRKKNGRIRR